MPLPGASESRRNHQRHRARTLPTLTPSRHITSGFGVKATLLGMALALSTLTYLPPRAQCRMKRRVTVRRKALPSPAILDVDDGMHPNFMTNPRSLRCHYECTWRIDLCPHYHSLAAYGGEEGFHDISHADMSQLGSLACRRQETIAMSNSAKCRFLTHTDTYHYVVELLPL